MQYTGLNKDNIADFLKYFSWNIGKNFDESQLKKWQGLDGATRDQYLDKLMESFGYDTDQRKMEIVQNYLNDQSKKAEKRPKRSSQKEAKSDRMPRAQRKQKKSTSPEFSDTPTKRNPIWSILIVLLVIAAGGYLWMKYSDYQNRDKIYCLASNVSIRKDLSGNENWGTRMDFLGKYRNASGKVIKSNYSLPIVDDDMYNEFYKVYMDTSFWQYLTAPEKTVGYVHSEFVTRNESEYEEYQRVFQYFEEDYTEMQNLPFRYRRILVNTIKSYSPLRNKTLSPPCYKDKGHTSNPKMSIGTKSMKVGLAKQYFVVARIDGLFYSILSNEDATEISVFDTFMKTRDGRQRMDRPGKFARSTGGTLRWEDCESEIKVETSSRPYDFFVDPELPTAAEVLDSIMDIEFNARENLDEELYE